MDFSIEKYISNFIQSQFPGFYRDEGENFILFVKAYYEWMETQGQPVFEARSVLNYRDIDDTLESFLEYFQKKYLYGIPFNVISNKRFLLKHILDVYRSKGSIQCYRLLFKLIYDEDVKVYLPSNDYIRASDGTWEEPKYLEVTPSAKNKDLLGKIIVGVVSGTTAVVENYVKESFDNDIINILYISNIHPKGGQFSIGEKIVLESQKNSANIFDYPTLVGSLDKINIINGGQGFRIGDLLKIRHVDPSTNQKLSDGVGGIIKVIELGRAEGQMNFDIQSGGFGYAANSKVFFYPNPLDIGTGASFKIFGLGDTQEVTYNTDLICDYLDVSFDATTYGFPGNTSANASSVLSNTTFQYANDTFGSIVSLTEIRTGNGYSYTGNVFVRSVLLSNNLGGSISYTTSCTHISGTSTQFTRFFENNDVVYLQANSSLSSSGEYAVIKTVTSDTQLVLYGKPSFNSTGSAKYKAAPTILPANFALYETLMKTTNNSIVGENEQILANPSFGTDIVANTKSFSSGKSYTDGELILAYRYGSLEQPTIVSAGQNYTNSDIVVFSGGGENFISPATANVVTNSSGNITSISVTYSGSGYTKDPKITIKTSNGTGAFITTKVKEFDTSSEIKGTVTKTSIGKAPGYWSTTRGFLNSDKRIHDSYYYQDYSYEIRVPLTLRTYKDILYNTFHSSGSELFGKYSLDYVVGKPLSAADFTVNVT